MPATSRQGTIRSTNGAQLDAIRPCNGIGIPARGSLGESSCYGQITGVTRTGGKRTLEGVAAHPSGERNEGHGRLRRRGGAVPACPLPVAQAPEGLFLV